MKIITSKVTAQTPVVRVTLDLSTYEADSLAEFIRTNGFLKWGAVSNPEWKLSAKQTLLTLGDAL